MWFIMIYVIAGRDKEHARAEIGSRIKSHAPNWWSVNGNAFFKCHKLDRRRRSCTHFSTEPGDPLLVFMYALFAISHTHTGRTGQVWRAACVYAQRMCTDFVATRRGYCAMSICVDMRTESGATSAIACTTTATHIFSPANNQFTNNIL